MNTSDRYRLVMHPSHAKHSFFFNQFILISMMSKGNHLKWYEKKVNWANNYEVKLSCPVIKL